MNLEQINNIYFIGIGGIGMSALARYFNNTGKTVAGYDRVRTELTDTLSNEGMDIHYEDNTKLINNKFNNPESTIVIYTPAIPSNHKELNYFRNNGFQIYKRSQILGILTKDKIGIAVAGTHGKTSISALLTHILNQTDEKCNAFLGGISKNNNSNYIFSSNSNRVVLEADEYDRSFLQLYPQIALITSIDADHLDIYGTHNELINSFNQFITQINCNGFLIYNKKIENDIKNKSIVESYSYSLEQSADFYAKNICIKNHKYCFDIVTNSGVISDIELGLPGKINVENAVGATSIASLLGVDEIKIKEGLNTFQGVQRRFDYQINTIDLVYIDDYAHHPQELSSTINSIKELYPNKKITGIFQPHLYTRTRDFASEFAKSLDSLDEIILLDIYPAREEPIKGVSSDIIYKDITNPNKMICKQHEVLSIIKDKKFEVLLTLGAGDIDQLVKPIKQLLKENS
ncbi:UDP-N-acetylmuramate--L-alanine ligase, partial [Bacteroidota bacterium]